MNDFVYGKIEEIKKFDDNKFSLIMSFGFPKGEISYESLKRYAKLLKILTDGKGYQYHLKQILKNIKKGDVLLTQILSFNPQTGFAHLELKRHPKVNGGLLAIDKGKIRAIVPGYDSKGYNRALVARRQPGSVFKSAVFFAALQLGWSILDSLDNTRKVFSYQGNFYYPRHDHYSPYKSTSMLWTGIMSENIASVYLAANLLEKLDYENFQLLLKSLKLFPNLSESPSEFRQRIEKRIGVSLDDEGIKEQLLKKIINETTAELAFSENKTIISLLKNMWFGRNYHQSYDDLINYMEDKYKKITSEEEKREFEKRNYHFYLIGK